MTTRLRPMQLVAALLACLDEYDDYRPELNEELPENGRLDFLARRFFDPNADPKRRKHYMDRARALMDKHIHGITE